MKKKLLALLCVLTCVFGLTACGSETTYTELEQNKMANCETLTYYSLSLAMSIDSDTATLLTDTYNQEELAYLYEDAINSQYGVEVEAELGAFDGLITTYSQMASDMGGVVNVGSMTSEINGDDIIVTVPVEGNDCDGTITFTYTNDIFFRFEEGNAVANNSLSQKLAEAGTHMGTAGLNTLLGMGTVFIMLILICWLIGLFKYIFKPKKAKETQAEAVSTPNVESSEEDLTDDTELVAVIMAAISAYEGSASTDGFVVRSIKKANRRM